MSTSSFIVAHRNTMDFCSAVKEESEKVGLKLNIQKN